MICACECTTIDMTLLPTSSGGWAVIVCLAGLLGILILLRSES